MSRLILTCLAILAWATSIAAHEVRPAIGNLTTRGDTLSLVIRFGSMEPILAGVNLQGVDNTNETEGAADVDALRALPPAAIEARVRAQAERILAPIVLTAPDMAPEVVPLRLVDVETDSESNEELPRETRVFIEASLPSGTSFVVLDWPAAYGVLILRQMDVEEGYTGFLTGGPTEPIALGGGGEQTFGQVVVTYLVAGFEHILPLGLDHILFVLGLFFLSTQLGPLLWQVSAFTLAHTVTLALGATGYVSVPASVVEPLIAASIVYVAVENLYSDRLQKWRTAVIFAFGLLHGLGFAYVLGEYGLPDKQFIPALIAFNVGVELGQLTVIAVAFLLVVLAQRVDEGRVDVRTGQIAYGVLAVAFALAGFVLNGPAFAQTMGAGAPVFLWPMAALSVGCLLSARYIDDVRAYRHFVVMPASLAIAAVGAWWFVERVFL